MRRFGRPGVEFYLVLAGLVLRVIFILVIAKPYFGRENIHVDGDTYSYAWSFQNLLETGDYTVNPDKEYGYFGRMPGYPFFIGAFYLLAGCDWDLAFGVITWVQVLLDLFSAWLLFLITLRITGKRRVARIALILAMTYPFTMVWTPVIYAETLGVSLIILTVYLVIRNEKPLSLLISGMVLGAAILVRPQAVFLIPALLCYLLIRYRKEMRRFLLQSVLLGLGCILVYGWWPARNYLNHGRWVLMQDLRGFYNWDEDALSFMQYMFSVKPGWEPQYTQLIRNEKVNFPKASYHHPGDSLLLERAVILARHCGSGISHKKGYWSQSFDVPNCNAEISDLFGRLADNQRRYNPLNYYVKVPLGNLKKALFKSELSDSGSLLRSLASGLFFYRSLLILLGIIGLCRPGKKGWEDGWASRGLLLLFFLTTYLLLCGGTAIQLRNIEMRYFLPADVLLLVPAAIFAGWCLELIRDRRNLPGGH